MKLSITNRGIKDFSIHGVKEDKKETRGTKNILKSATKESMVVSATTLKFDLKENSPDLR